MKLRLAAAALLLAAAGWRLTAVAEKAAASFTYEEACREERDRNVEAGEALLHGLPHYRVSWSMPGYTLAGALVCHAGPGRLTRAPAAALWASAGGAAAMGAALSGPLGAGAAAALYAFTLDPREAFNDRWAYVLAVILVGLAAVWRARRPSTARAAALGASTGFSLLFLSSLFLYPALVAAAAAARRRWKEALLALLLPALFLAPWVVLNRRVWGEFVPLERGRAVANVITGAAGVLRPVWFENSRSLAGVDEGSPWPWAVAQVASHPRLYASAVARRLKVAFGRNPLLLLLAGAALLLRRRDPPVRALGLLAAYFLGVHCLMPVDDRYFSPLWPLTACLAAALLKPRVEDCGAWERVAAVAAAPLVLWAAAFAPFVLWRTLSFPGKAADDGALARELGRRPEDPWLWTYQGRALLDKGRAAEAEDSFARAQALAPSPDREYLRALAGALQGKSPPADLMPRRLGEQRELLLLAVWRLSAGREKDAWRALDAAAQALEALRRERWAKTGEEWARRSQEAARVELQSQLLELSRRWPARTQARLLKGLARRSGGGPGFFVDHDALARAALARAKEARTASAPEAADLLELSCAFAAKVDRLGDDYAAGLADAAPPLSRVKAAAAVLARAVERQPGRPALLLELARVERAAGRPKEAAAALARAQALLPGRDMGRRLESASRELGDQSAALALALFERDDLDGGFKKLSEPAAREALSDYCVRPGRDCAAWRRAEEKVKALAEEGMRAFAAGDAAGADRLFGRVLLWLPDAPDALMNKAAAASALGRLEEAESLYCRALSARAAAPGLESEILSSRAGVRERRGLWAEAAADLRAALKAAPAGWRRRAETRERLVRLVH